MAKVKLTKVKLSNPYLTSDDYQTKDGRFYIEKKWGLGNTIWWLIKDEKDEVPPGMCQCDTLTEVRETLEYYI